MEPISSGVAPRFVPKGKHNNLWNKLILGVVFLIASSLFCWYWTGFPLNNMQFEYGFLRANTDRHPTQFRSSRYTWEWWSVWLLNLNWLLPYLLAASLLNNSTPDVAWAHRNVSTLGLLLNLAVFAMLTVQWFVFCNNASYPGHACNDRRWCCVNYANTEGAFWCPNTNATHCTIAITGSELTRSDPFFQAWLFSILFFLWAWTHKVIGRKLYNDGVFIKV